MFIKTFGFLSMKSGPPVLSGTRTLNAQTIAIHAHITAWSAVFQQHSLESGHLRCSIQHVRIKNDEISSQTNKPPAASVHFPTLNSEGSEVAGARLQPKWTLSLK